MTEANFSDRPANLPTRRQRLLRWITRVCFWFPVVFVAGITVYGWYVYVIEFCCIHTHTTILMSIL